MPLNMRKMFYSRRTNENWKDYDNVKVSGGVSNMVYNTYETPNNFKANPIKHWRRQSSSGSTSKMNLINEINKPGGATTSKVNRCPDKTPLQLDYRLSKDSGCCDYQQKKAIQLTRHYTKGINDNIKYGNNNLNSSDCYCDNSMRYYHHSGSYLERKKQRVFKKELSSNILEHADCCNLAEQITDPDEKYFQIHGYNRSLTINDKCKC